MSEETYKNLDEAVTEHIKSNGEDGIFITGWVIVASLSSLEHDSTNSDGYVTFTSQGLPHHTKIGLLNVSLDDTRAMAMFSAMSSVVMNMNDDEESDD